MDASLIVTCKGRADHLGHTLPFMADQKGVSHELVLVDYGDPDESWKLMQDQTTEHKMVVRVLEDTDTFNLNRARNFGATLSTSAVLAFVDADVFLAAEWLRTVLNKIDRGFSLVTRGGNARGVTGTFAVTRKLYSRVRGFDESISGWGYDEVDFFKRCQRVASSCTYDPKLVRAISHTDDLRTRYYEEKDMWKSERHNAHVAAFTDRDVNPLGYAKGRAICTRGPTVPHAG